MLLLLLICLVAAPCGRRVRTGIAELKTTDVLHQTSPKAAFIAFGQGGHYHVGDQTIHCSCSLASDLRPCIRAKIKCGKAPVFLRTTPAYLLATEIDVGTIVEFSPKANNVVLGAVSEPDGKKNWRVLTSSGNTASVTPRQIRFIVEGNVAPVQFAERLEELEAAVAELPSFESLEELSEMAADEGELSLSELSELLLGDSSATSVFVMYRSLTSSAEGRIFFRSADKTGEHFTVRPGNEVENLRKSYDAEKSKQQEMESLKARFSAASAANPLDLAAESEYVQKGIAAVARLGCRAGLDLTEDKEEKTDSLAREFLKYIGRKATVESARFLMVDLGLWSQHEDLELIRLRVPVEFSNEQNAHAEDLISAPPPDADADKRRDLTHLHAFAIDEESTREIDDAVSVELLDEKDGGGQLLWVHVADPTRYVLDGSLLQKEAARRGSSIYTPTVVIPMLPMQLAEGPCSLGTGGEKPSCALSIGVRLDPFGFIDRGFDPIITPSHVRVQRLTYNDVDALLEDPDIQGQATHAEAPPDLDEGALEVLRLLESTSNDRFSKRRSMGAMESICGKRSLPDLSVKAMQNESELDGWSVEVGAGGARADGPARQIVTEMMLLAGEAVAMYARKHDVPLPFRAQSFKEVLTIEEIEAYPEGPCRSWLAIRSMAKGNVGPNAVKHEGLGLDAYVQVTSPIRRYADFAVHYQLKAHIRGVAPLPFPSGKMDDGSKLISEIVEIARDGGALARDIERSANTYWLGEWLKRHQEKMEALVLGPIFRNREGNSEYKLLLVDADVTVDCTSAANLTAGDVINVMPDRTGRIVF